MVPKQRTGVTWSRRPTLSPRLDLVSRRWTRWSPWHGFCGRWEVFRDLHYITLLKEYKTAI